MSPPALPYWKISGFLSYVMVYMVACQAVWEYPTPSLTTVPLKLLPTIQLILIIKSKDMLDHRFRHYKKWVLYGLLFSMGGDAMLVWRIRLFIPALLFFAIAQISYICAFGFTPPGSGRTAAFSVVLGGSAFYTVSQCIEDSRVLYILVFMYCVLIFTMLWRAIVCLQVWPSFSSVFACAGAVSFVASDFMIAYDKWCYVIDGAPLYVMMTYFLAQLFIAISTASYEIRPLEMKLRMMEDPTK